MVSFAGHHTAAAFGKKLVAPAAAVGLKVVAPTAYRHEAPPAHKSGSNYGHEAFTAARDSI